MTRSALAVAAAIVSVLVIALAWQVRSGDRELAAPDLADAPMPPATSSDLRATRPGAGSDPQTQTPAPNPEHSENMSGDVSVRDHRTGDRPPAELPPIVAPLGGRTFPRELTTAITQRFREVLGECAAAITATDRGNSPRVEGTLVVAIKDQQVVVTRAAVKLREVIGASAELVRQCLEQKSLGLSASAADQADLQNYAISISYAVP
ncbi:MAG: hypothetical protein AB7O24_30290 [Kofleriaceae bacterium]